MNGNGDALWPRMPPGTVVTSQQLADAHEAEEYSNNFSDSTGAAFQGHRLSSELVVKASHYWDSIRRVHRKKKGEKRSGRSESLRPSYRREHGEFNFKTFSRTKNLAG